MLGEAVVQDDAADRHALLGRPAVVLQLVSLREVGGEQFGHLTKRLVEDALELGRVIDGPQIAFFRDGPQMVRCPRDDRVASPLVMTQLLPALWIMTFSRLMSAYCPAHPIIRDGQKKLNAEPLEWLSSSIN